MTPLDYQQPERPDRQPRRGRFALLLLIGALFILPCILVNTGSAFIDIATDILMLLSLGAALIVSMLAVVRTESRTKLAWVVFGITSAFWATIAAWLIQDIIR